MYCLEIRRRAFIIELDPPSMRRVDGGGRVCLNPPAVIMREDYVDLIGSVSPEDDDLLLDIAHDSLQMYRDGDLTLEEAAEAVLGFVEEYFGDEEGEDPPI